MRYEVAHGGTLTDGKVFFDINKSDGKDTLDGLKVDSKGNVFYAGPDGIWVISPMVKYLGSIRRPNMPPIWPGRRWVFVYNSEFKRV
jgi:sugar lactone lactonase YvrE